ncbi:MotA/TolQ/ExbB proton channel family protein [Candidatus Thiosymbion oneisti]|uniref:MotA/TolQ/ExbB proton channel family protein n=1 Tax=Candidatus Thiosymbion oneisti TaxID=589554 RepID=UPI000A4576F7|nr:MotA/TolQ/ExbB proton channel family protein [Candidatus Thiosymbion oneisti]
MTEAPIPKPDGYRANRLLVILVLITVGIYALIWDLRPLGVPDIGDWSAEWLSLLGVDRLAEPIGRFTDSAFKQGMLAALVVLTVYGVLQAWGAAADGRCLSRLDTGRGIGCDDAGLWALFTARPRGLHAHLGRTSVLSMHFGFGRRHLLEPLRLGLWAFPVVGFIGTVLGISQAVKELPLAMKEETALQGVLDSLHLAFDTTFIGLVASVIVMSQLYLLDARWTLNQEQAASLSEAGSANDGKGTGATDTSAAESRDAQPGPVAASKSGGPTPVVGQTSQGID